MVWRLMIMTVKCGGLKFQEVKKTNNPRKKCGGW
jgi:hypothetical protein